MESAARNPTPNGACINAADARAVTTQCEARSPTTWTARAHRLTSAGRARLQFTPGPAATSNAPPTGVDHFFESGSPHRTSAENPAQHLAPLGHRSAVPRSPDMRPQLASRSQRTVLPSFPGRPPRAHESARGLHLLERRDRAFRDDAVLQENAIAHAAREPSNERRPLTVGRRVPMGQHGIHHRSIRESHTRSIETKVINTIKTQQVAVAPISWTASA